MSEPVAALPAASSPTLPARYGRYVLVKRLGAGGMAEVFRAVLVGVEEFQSTLVVKWILPHLSANPAFIKMFIDEAKLCGRLLHPNIVRVHEFGKQDGRFFIAMEYVHGATIGAIMTRLIEQQRLMPPDHRGRDHPPDLPRAGLRARAHRRRAASRSASSIATCRRAT